MKYLNPLAVAALLVCPLSGARADDVSTPTAPAPTSALTEPSAEPAKIEQGAAVPKVAEPFAFADFTWVPGNGRTTDNPLSLPALTGEFRFDGAYHYSYNRPQDDTISDSSEVFRHNELQVTMLGVGGDFHYDNVIGRVMTQFGMYSTTTPRNDASPGRGQWDLSDAMRYISEAYGGYHIDVLNGINVEAGLFMSYVGLWSYYQADNWTYQPSYVSSNTPWFFEGMRVQIFVTDKLKIEPWLVNGWQSYGMFNHSPGGGGQILWRPTGWLSILGNQYYGTDTLANPDRKRVHTDDSIMVKYHDNPESVFDKAAASLTLDAGCEWGGGAACTVNQYFLGFMAYTRFWFLHDHFGLTLGGGAINNPGRYLVLLPPINGATAFSGTAYFPENPGLPFKAWDMQITGDYMPSQFITFRAEFVHRAANVNYFAGPGGVTPVVNGVAGNVGAPGSNVSGWTPDLVKSENRITLALLVKI